MHIKDKTSKINIKKKEEEEKKKKKWNMKI